MKHCTQSTKKLQFALFAIVLTTAISSGCSAAKRPFNHPTHTFNGAFENPKDVQAGVRNGILSAGWNLLDEAPGETVASVKSRGHYAKVIVKYTKSEYTIRMVESNEEQWYDRATARGRYTFWVNRLHRHLRKELYLLASSDHVSYSSLPVDM